MGYLRETELGLSFPSFAAVREQLGFVPNVLRAQTLLPRVIDAEARILATILFHDQALSRIQKERIALTVAVASRNQYCATLHDQMLSLLGAPEISPAETALLDFALKLGLHGPFISKEDVTGLFEHGWNDESVLEAVLVTALACFLCTLSTGVGAVPDFERKQIPAGNPLHFQVPEASSGPYLRAVELSPDRFAPFVFFRENFGFIPNLYRAQTLRPDVLGAEAGAIGAVLLTEDVLTRVQKERILLAVSAANLNTYCVAVHSEILRVIGVSTENSAQAAADHHLLNFASKLATRPSETGREDIELLRQHGFAEEQILEAVVMTALTNFLNTLQMGLGVNPDFAPDRVFRPTLFEKEHLLAADQRHTNEALVVDPDAEPVARVQAGDLDAFEVLINRHSQRVYRTLVGILGNPEEARDAMQDTFLKAFQHLGDFQGRSKFSTWVVSIASNTGLQRLRERKHTESLDDDGPESEESFRPRQIRAWTDDPEQLYVKSEMRSLVESSVMKLPGKYRVVLVLRDMEQLSTEEAAAALGLGIPALKARLLRGRLMLREALAPHFTGGVMGVPS